MRWVKAASLPFIVLACTPLPTLRFDDGCDGSAGGCTEGDGGLVVSADTPSADPPPAESPPADGGPAPPAVCPNAAPEGAAACCGRVACVGTKRDCEERCSLCAACGTAACCAGSKGQGVACVPDIAVCRLGPENNGAKEGS